ncbi:MAG: acyl-CoA dehydrogenase [Actinomycetota bacterium]|jgi:acyl-CoA dehydrogenase
MSWDFKTDDEFQAQLDWMDEFVRTEIEPLDILFRDLAYSPLEEPLKGVVDRLKQEVKDRHLWACHLGPDLGGEGYGQLKLALMNEILGRSPFAPVIFGCQAPDTGNAEIIAHYGTEEQKAKWLQPLLNGEVFSCYSMTEPQGGSDPTMFTTRAVRDGDEWVINGEKFFSSNLNTASFLIVMAVTNTEVSAYRGMSMFLVPAGTPGINVLANIGIGGEPFNEGGHAHVRYENVRVPLENLLGGEGQAFEVAQRRLGGGRIHHAMRGVAAAQKQFDMMCERALSRTTQGELLAKKQMVQEMVADAWIKVQQFRLMVLHTAWLIDQSSTAQTRQYIAACKVLAADVLTDLSEKCLHLHGALGTSNLMELGTGYGMMMGIMDGPSEVHKVTIARQVLKQYEASPDMWPTEFVPRKLVNARRNFEANVEKMGFDLSAFNEVLQRSRGDDATINAMEAYLDATIGNL